MKYRHTALMTVCLAVAGGFLTAACNETACPLNNTIAAHYKFYTRQGTGLEPYTLMDTLTITAAGTDSILLNRSYQASGMDLPMSYHAPVDTLRFRFADADGRVTTDTVWIEKESKEHFESPDCPTVVFHQIKGIRSTHRQIDSILIVNPNIDYNETEHFKVIFHRFD